MNNKDKIKNIIISISEVLNFDEIDEIEKKVNKLNTREISKKIISEAIAIRRKELSSKIVDEKITDLESAKSFLSEISLSLLGESNKKELIALTESKIFEFESKITPFAECADAFKSDDLI